MKTCQCDYPYEGTRMLGSPNICERCLGLIDEAAVLRLKQINDAAMKRLMGEGGNHGTE